MENPCDRPRRLSKAERKHLEETISFLYSQKKTHEISKMRRRLTKGTTSSLEFMNRAVDRQEYHIKDSKKKARKAKKEKKNLKGKKKCIPRKAVAEGGLKLFTRSEITNLTDDESNREDATNSTHSLQDNTYSFQTKDEHREVCVVDTSDVPTKSTTHRPVQSFATKAKDTDKNNHDADAKIIDNTDVNETSVGTFEKNFNNDPSSHTQLKGTTRTNTTNNLYIDDVRRGTKVENVKQYPEIKKNDTSAANICDTKWNDTAGFIADKNSVFDQADSDNTKKSQNSINDTTETRDNFDKCRVWNDISVEKVESYLGASIVGDDFHNDKIEYGNTGNETNAVTGKDDTGNIIGDGKDWKTEKTGNYPDVTISKDDVHTAVVKSENARNGTSVATNNVGVSKGVGESGTWNSLNGEKVRSYQDVSTARDDKAENVATFTVGSGTKTAGEGRNWFELGVEKTGGYQDVVNAKDDVHTVRIDSKNTKNGSDIATDHIHSRIEVDKGRNLNGLDVEKTGSGQSNRIPYPNDCDTAEENVRRAQQISDFFTEQDDWAKGMNGDDEDVAHFYGKAYFENKEMPPCSVQDIVSRMYEQFTLAYIRSNNHQQKVANTTDEQWSNGVHISEKEPFRVEVCADPQTTLTPSVWRRLFCCGKQIKKREKTSKRKEGFLRRCLNFFQRK